MFNSNIGSGGLLYIKGFWEPFKKDVIRSHLDILVSAFWENT